MFGHPNHLDDHYIQIIDILKNDPEWIKQYGREYSNINRKDVVEVLSKMTTQQLVFLFKKMWIGSQNSFCKHYKINPTNFSRWLSGKKNSHASAKATLDFLINGTPDVFKYNIICSNSTNIGYCDKKLNIIKDRFHSPGNALKHLVSMFKCNPEIKTVIMIDADNCSHCINQLASIQPSSKFSSQWPIHVIAYLRKAKVPNPIRKYIMCSWLTVINSLGKARNAADTVFVWVSSRIASLSIDDMHYILVSSDRFIEELYLLFKEDKCYVDRIPSFLHIGAWLLSKKDISSLTVPSDIQTLNVIKQTKQAFQNALDIIKQLKVKTLKQFIDIFKEHISDIDNLMGIDVYDVSLVLARDYDWPGSHFKMDTSEITEDDLRLEFKVCWKSTIEKFCKIYCVDDQIFLSWLKKSTVINQNISSAIHKWIQER